MMFESGATLVNSKTSNDKNLPSSSPLNMTREIVSLVNNFIESCSMGVMPLIERSNEIIKIDPRVLQDEHFSKEINKAYLNLLVFSLERGETFDVKMTFHFMQNRLLLKNSYFKREPASSMILNAARNGILNSLKGEGCGTCANDIIEIMNSKFQVSQDKIFASPDIKEAFLKLCYGAIKTGLICGCTEEAQNVISFMENYLDFNKNRLKTCFNRFTFKKAIAKGFIEEGLSKNCDEWMYDDMISFAVEYLGFPESNIRNYLNKIKQEYKRS